MFLLLFNLAAGYVFFALSVQAYMATQLSKQGGIVAHQQRQYNKKQAMLQI